jgi:hypothetical protein
VPEESEEPEEIRILPDDAPPAPRAPAAAGPARAGNGEGGGPRPPPALGPTMIDALSFPFRGEGWLILLGGAIAYSALYVPTLVDWRGSPLTFLGHLLLDVYLVLYVYKLAGLSWKDPKQMPEWPDLADYRDDIGMPLLLTVGAAFVSFLPAAVLATVLPAPLEPFALVGVAAGLFYFPMQYLAATVIQAPRALSPVLVLRSIARTHSRYAVCVASVFGTALSAGASVLWLWFPFGREGWWFFLPVLNLAGWGAFHFCLIYTLAVLSRLLGRFYFTHAKTLGWFEPSSL